jgi:glycine oxidase
MQLGRPVWRDLVDGRTLRVLDPGRPDTLHATPDVLVVGGGMIGLATAALCTRAGLGHVTLIERDSLAAAASGRAAALLSPEPHAWTDSPAFVALGRRSFDLWKHLDEEWDGALAVESCAWLVALPEPIPPETDLGTFARVLDAHGAHAVEPELGEVAGAIQVLEQGRVHPLVAAATFAARTGTVVTGVEMTGIETQSSRVTTVHTNAGDVHPGVVVFATGLAPELPALHVPQRWIKGHLLATAPAPFRLRSSIAALEGLVVQLPTGQIIAGGTLDEGDDEPDVRPDVIAGIRDGLAALLPRTAALDVVHEWCCFRPATVDHEPVIDRVPDLDNAWITCGHFRTGILMAPVTGESLARWIHDGSAPPELHGFGVSRFGPG